MIYKPIADCLRVHDYSFTIVERDGMICNSYKTSQNVLSPTPPKLDYIYQLDYIYLPPEKKNSQEWITSRKPPVVHSIVHSTSDHPPIHHSGRILHLLLVHLYRWQTS